jgi:hypothetical protein
MHMRRCWFCACLCAISILTPAACLGANHPKIIGRNEIGRYRVLLTNGIRFQGTDGILTNDSISGFDIMGIKTTYAVDSIRYLERCTGTRAGVGFAIGALCGLAVALPFAVSETDAHVVNGVYQFPKQVFHPEVVLGGAAAGGLLGLLVGSSDRKWEAIPLMTSFGLKTGRQRFTGGIVIARRL